MKILLFQHHFTFTSFIILMLLPPISYCQEDDGYEVCARSFDCGNLKNLSYPFWSENGDRSLLCGEEEFKLNCTEGQNPSFIFEAMEYVVSNINLSTNTITISLGDICPVGTPMTTRLNEIMSSAYGDGLQNISLFYQCNSVPPTPPKNAFPCPRFGERRDAFFTNDTESNPAGCLNRVEVLVPRVVIENVMNGVQEVERIVTERFNVIYLYDGLCSRCNDTGGICGTNLTTGEFACHCERDHPDPYTCFGESGTHTVAFSFCSHFYMCLLLLTPHSMFLPFTT